MLENVIENKNFALMMKRHIGELVVHFFEQEQNFGILCKVDDVQFEPALPESIKSEFRSLTLFFLAGYTFETARIDDDFIIFEAGFGADNFGSLVSVPLLSIMQVIVDETPVLINLARYIHEPVVEKEVDENGVKNSMDVFLSNPENSKFLKK
ncbi:MAG: hypothetical protein FP820_02030 [Sulfurimonas sp.]|nr:hypothetical protein [Sulfurimonas sp.]MBU1217178.1 hypothetical protein [bacterium]MBU1433964.1 hypothetical protein [bacterium]MBU1502946.1 hypothetical protein [bacterium]MBU3938274.1 hypothetical protein [bacterium]